MIRKNALSLILTAVLALAILAALAAPVLYVSGDSGSTAGWHTDTIVADELPTPTPTGGGGSGTDSNPSGGGNTGG